MEVEVEGEVKVVSAGPGSTVGEVMGELGVTPEGYIAVLDGRVVTEKEPVPAGARLQLVRVWSSG